MKAPLLVCNTFFPSVLAKVQMLAGMHICKDTKDPSHIHSNNPQAAIRQWKQRHHDYKFKIFHLFVWMKESLSTEMHIDLALSQDHITLSCVTLCAAQSMACEPLPSCSRSGDAQLHALVRKKGQNIHIPIQLAAFQQSLLLNITKNRFRNSASISSSCLQLK